jgi:hypothetical protein
MRSSGLRSATVWLECGAGGGERLCAWRAATVMGPEGPHLLAEKGLSLSSTSAAQGAMEA